MPEIGDRVHVRRCPLPVDQPDPGWGEALQLREFEGTVIASTGYMEKGWITVRVDPQYVACGGNPGFLRTWVCHPDWIVKDVPW